MRIEERVWKASGWHVTKNGSLKPENVQLVLVFGDYDAIKEKGYYEELKTLYPNAHIVGASTGGTIESGSLSEAPLVATAVALERGRVEVVRADDLENATLQSRARALIEQLPKEELRHVFILMDGLGGLDASLMVKGVKGVHDGIPLTGGLAGDDGRFERTLVFADGEPSEHSLVAVGFYGDGLHVRVGCETGWEEFGAERIVTRSQGNIVYEIDHKPALKLYEDYLGDFIKDLPASGLRFPLNVKQYEGDKEVVRVMMGINPDNSLFFAGDIPQGSTVRLMKTNVTNLIDGADLVASLIRPLNDKPALAIAVSCAGRRSVLNQMVDEELSALKERLGGNTHICGFYAYGEIAPFSDNLADCKLHNQTMTLSVIYED